MCRYGTPREACPCAGDRGKSDERLSRLPHLRSATGQLVPRQPTFALFHVTEPADVKGPELAVGEARTTEVSPVAPPIVSVWLRAGLPRGR